MISPLFAVITSLNLLTASFIWPSDKTGVAMKTVSYWFNMYKNLVIKKSTAKVETF